MKNKPGPFAPPGKIRPSLNITALSNSFTIYNEHKKAVSNEDYRLASIVKTPTLIQKHKLNGNVNAIKRYENATKRLLQIPLSSGAFS